MSNVPPWNSTAVASSPGWSNARGGYAGVVSRTAGPCAPRNRLTLARWFFSPDQPLTARVAVNRYWEELFGTGMVETLEDFGSAGEKPSHPELLDWLALHFQNDLHWNTKALLREMVTSATYRQSARTTPVLRQPTRTIVFWRMGRSSGSRLKWCATRRCWPVACSIPRWAGRR